MLLVLSHAALGGPRLAAFVAFALLLGALVFGWYRLRQRLAQDEAEAALEAEFLQLEREQLPPWNPPIEEAPSKQYPGFM
jgi:hypothetical protein